MFELALKLDIFCCRKIRYVAAATRYVPCRTRRCPADGLVRGSQGLTERKRGAVSTAQGEGRAVPDREHKLIGVPAKRRLCGGVASDGL